MMRRITAEIWDKGRLDLIDKYIAKDLVDRCSADPEAVRRPSDLHQLDAHTVRVGDEHEVVGAPLAEGERVASRVQHRSAVFDQPGRDRVDVVDTNAQVLKPSWLRAAAGRPCTSGRA